MASADRRKETHIHALPVVTCMSISTLGIYTQTDGHGEQYSLITIFMSVQAIFESSLISSNYIQPVGLSEAQRMFVYFFSHTLSTMEFFPLSHFKL